MTKRCPYLSYEKLECCPLTECPCLKCELRNLKSECGSFTDPRDSRTYRTIKIGEQVWMAENLAFDYAGSYCYENNTELANKYGRLYSWYTAMKAAPPGWHLPTEHEWHKLIKSVGGTPVTDAMLLCGNGCDTYYDKIRSYMYTGNVLQAGKGDEFGFSMLPCGHRHPDGTFKELHYEGYIWTASECRDAEQARYLKYKTLASACGVSKSYGLSVRLVKD